MIVKQLIKVYTFSMKDPRNVYRPRSNMMSQRMFFGIFLCGCFFLVYKSIPLYKELAFFTQKQIEEEKPKGFNFIFITLIEC